MSPYHRLHHSFPTRRSSDLIRELVDGRRRHADGRRATHEHARDTRTEQNPPRRDGTGAEDRELVTAMTFRHPRRFVPERFGKPHALDDVGGRQAAAEGDAQTKHARSIRLDAMVTLSPHVARGPVGDETTAA